MISAGENCERDSGYCYQEEAKGKKKHGHSLCSCRPFLSAVISPLESTVCNDSFRNQKSQSHEKKVFTYILLFASSSDWPKKVKNDTSCLATPMPADPAPKKRIRWSSRRVPAAFEEIFAALMKPERTTAPEMIGNETSLATSTNRLYLSLVSCNIRNVRNKINAKRT